MLKNVFSSSKFCIIALSSLVFATGTDKHNQGDEILRYTAKAIKDTFYLGEPIIIKHIMINSSDSSIYLCEYSDCGTISITTPSSPLGFRHGDSRKKPSKESFFIIPPNGIITSSTDASSDIHDPGIYFYSSSKSYKQDGSEFGLNAWTGHLSSVDTFIVVKSNKDLEDASSVKKYLLFLQQLDTLDMASIRIAEWKLADIHEFKKRPPDSVCRAFMKFYRTCLGNQHKNFYTNKDYQDCLHEMSFAIGHTLGNPLPTFEKLDNENAGQIRNKHAQSIIDLKNYNRCGITFYQAEGEWYLTEASDFLEELSRIFRGEMSEYMIFLSSEFQERLAEDFGLLISWDDLRKRIIRWEQFSKKHKTLPETEIKVKPHLRTLVNIYLIGIDNTRAYGMSTGELDNNLKLSYQNFIQENKDSDYYAIIDSVYGMLEKTRFKVNHNLIIYLDSIGYATQYFVRWANKFITEQK